MYVTGYTYAPSIHTEVLQDINRTTSSQVKVKFDNFVCSFCLFLIEICLVKTIRCTLVYNNYIANQLKSKENVQTAGYATSLFHYWKIKKKKVQILQTADME